MATKKDVFNVADAKKAGTSDADILSYLEKRPDLIPSTPIPELTKFRAEQGQNTFASPLQRAVASFGTPEEQNRFRTQEGLTALNKPGFEAGDVTGASAEALRTLFEGIGGFGGAIAGGTAGTAVAPGPGTIAGGGTGLIAGQAAGRTAGEQVTQTIGNLLDVGREEGTPQFAVDPNQLVKRGGEGAIAGGIEVGLGALLGLPAAGAVRAARTPAGKKAIGEVAEAGVDAVRGVPGAAKTSIRVARQTVADAPQRQLELALQPTVTQSKRNLVPNISEVEDAIKFPFNLKETARQSQIIINKKKTARDAVVRSLDEKGVKVDISPMVENLRIKADDALRAGDEAKASTIIRVNNRIAQTLRGEGTDSIIPLKTLPGQQGYVRDTFDNANDILNKEISIAKAQEIKTLINSQLDELTFGVEKRGFTQAQKDTYFELKNAVEDGGNEAIAIIDDLMAKPGGDTIRDLNREIHQQSLLRRRVLDRQFKSTNFSKATDFPVLGSLKALQELPGPRLGQAKTLESIIGPFKPFIEPAQEAIQQGAPNVITTPNLQQLLNQ